MTSDRHNYLLDGFVHQYEKYGCNYPVYVYGFTPYSLPVGYTFTSLGNFYDYPASKWSNALIKVLDLVGDDYIMLMLEDYWLASTVFPSDLAEVVKFMSKNPDIIRFDLTQDRLKCGDVVDTGLDICGGSLLLSGKTQYTFSLQCGMWNTKLLRSVLVENESPWQVELEGTGRINASNYLVYGSSLTLVDYQIACINGKLQLHPTDPIYPEKRLRTEDLVELDAMYNVKQIPTYP